MSSPGGTPAPGLSLEVRGRAARRLDAGTRKELLRRVGRAMQAAGEARAELALSLSDDAELKQLNLTYAGEDHATDVLSFSQREGEPPGRGVARAAPALPLGDVIISIETAARQARAGGRSLLDELVHLAVHGLVHLLGYDHASPEEEGVMFGYEARLRIASVGRGPVPRKRRPKRPVR